MKGRDNKAIMIKKGAAGAQTTDLLVCFPSRAHLTLLPKHISSPARLSDTIKRPHHLRRGDAGLPGHHVWTKNNKQKGSEMSEPTSPKVTCAGQIKVRHKTGQCKSWQSVMEQIERIHNKSELEKKRSSSWAESSIGFLTCLRNIKFDFRCFGNFPSHPDITSEDEDEDEDEDEVSNETPRAMFSKWFMVLQENSNTNNYENNIKTKDVGNITHIDHIQQQSKKTESYTEEESSAIPPPNALLLMRCRSAPAKSWLEEEEEEEEEKENNKKSDIFDQHEEYKEKDLKKRNSLKLLMDNDDDDDNNNDEDEDNIMNDNNLVMMSSYDSEFYKLSSEIAKETWVVGEIKDLLSRSRSCKR